MLNYSRRVVRHQFFVSLSFNAARVSRMMIISFLLWFFPGDFDLSCVEHDDKIAGIEIRNECRLMFAHEQVCYLRGKLAQDLPRGINNMTLAFDILSFG